RMQSIDYTTNSLNYISSDLQKHFENVFYTSQEIMYDNNIFDIFNGNFDKKLIMDKNEKEQIQKVIQRIILSKNDITAVSLQIGVNNFSTYKKQNMIYKYNSESYNKIYKMAKEKNGKSVWYVDYYGDKVSNIFFARTVYNPHTFEEAGLLIFQIDENIFSSINQEFNIGTTQTFSILSKENIVINRNNNGNIKNIDDLNFETIKTNNEGIIRNKGDMILFSKLSEPNWYVVSNVELKGLYANVLLLIRYTAMLCILSTLILFLFNWYFKKEFLKPVINLSHVMNLWKENDDFIDKHIDKDIERTDEIGMLYKSFYNMTQRIKMLINRNYRDQIIKKNIGMKMLQAQINPHFLFNTFESINSMAHLNDIPEISNVITALSDILEQSMGRDSKLIPLSKELVHIDNYIYILKVRFEEKIRFIKKIDDNTLNIMIPSLILQPIVENAVYHGIMPSHRNGILKIISYIQGDDLIIEVVDDGVGIEKENVDKLNESFNIDNNMYFDEEENNERIGMENVNRRIRLLCGNDYGLMVESEIGEFTRITVRFKLNISEGDDIV
ncbi:MAG: histidine kinase, partial [Oscillospiraceae bacterium]